MFQSQSPIETVFASIVLALCVVLLLRMLLPMQPKARLDASVRRALRATRRAVMASWRWPLARRRAVRAANEAIRRARSSSNGAAQAPWEGEREGNVYKPKSFRRPRKPH